MARLIYAAITSLDGFIEDESGKFDWAMPDAEVHEHVNELERSVRTFLYGRRMYETMAVWQTIGVDDGEPGDPAQSDEGVHPAERDFAEVWRAADKVVYSRTLDAVWTSRTRLEHDFDPGAVRRLKDTADADISVSGPGLAEHAFAAGLVDEVQLYAFPIVVGGGKPGLPRGVRQELELLDERRFANGVVHTRYGRR